LFLKFLKEVVDLGGVEIPVLGLGFDLRPCGGRLRRQGGDGWPFEKQDTCGGGCAEDDGEDDEAPVGGRLLVGF
jgi:hypothetical protein